MADTSNMAQNPFAVMTFIAAPALLTNASSLLAMSTTQRMLHTRESMRLLLAKAEAALPGTDHGGQLVTQINRVEAQAGLLLRALRAVYLALGSFSGATLVTLLGAALSQFQMAMWFQLLSVVGIALGLAGVGCLIFGSARLFQATRLSLANIRDEADRARKHFHKPEVAREGGAASPSS